MPSSGNNGNTNVINNLIKLDNFDNRNRSISNLNYTYQEPNLLHTNNYLHTKNNELKLAKEETIL